MQPLQERRPDRALREASLRAPLVVHGGEDVRLGVQVAEDREHPLGSSDIEQEVVNQGDAPGYTGFLHPSRVYATADASTVAGVKVGVDARALLGGRGIARYTGELLATLTHRFPDDDFRVLVHGAERGHIPDAVTVVEDHRPQQLLFGCMAVTGRPRLDRLLGGDLDVVWAPAPAPLAVGSAVPLVLTLHDLSFEQRPGDFTRYERLWHRAARPHRLVRRADRILADSEHTRAAAVAARASLATPFGSSFPG